MQLKQLFFLLFFGAITSNSIFAQIPINEQDSLKMAQLRSRALTLDSIIRSDPAKQTGSFQTNSLPIGIVREVGGTKFIICIDSARFTPTGATFDVYMAIDWPNSQGKLAFAAKRIPFNPKGVMGGMSEDITLKLIGDQTIKLGPNNKLVFKGDGTNYIQWGCNGYERMNINADIHFSKDIIHGENNTTVIANLSANVADIKNVMFQTTVSPFYVKGLKDFKFTLNQLTIDQSIYENPSDISLPVAYNEVYPEIEQWKGFYANQLTITLPDKWSKSAGGTSIGVQGLRIDDEGVSGDFFASNIFAMGEGKMDAWGFSLDTVLLGLECNNLVKARLAGKLKIEPLGDAQLRYNASMYREHVDSLYEYSISAVFSKTQIYQFKPLNAQLKLLANSGISIRSAGNTFKPLLTLNGSLSMDLGKFALDSLKFSNLKVTTQAPYLLSGQFSLISSGKRVGNFPITLNSIGLGIADSTVAFSVGVGLQIGNDDTQNSFGVTTTVVVKTKKTIDQETGRNRLEYKKCSISDIAVNAETSSFHLAALLAYKDDDTLFGKMFFGSVSFKIDKFMPSPALASIGFGRRNDKKYWYFDAAVPVNIPLGSAGMTITNLFGGVSYRVKSKFTTTQQLERAFGGAIGTNTAPLNTNTIPFTPNDSVGFSFSAGIAMANMVESVFNAEAIFSMTFNSSGGLANINFAGRAFMMVNRTVRNSPTSILVKGNVGINYDHTHKVFDAQASMRIYAEDVIDGQINAVIHVDTTNWYFWLNRPINRAYLNVINVFNANAYFMVGTQIDPIPAPPAYVTNLVSTSPIISTNNSAISSGQGFATGMQISVGFDGEFPKTTEWRGYVAVNIGAGFDITMFKLINGTHCQGSSTPAGVNGWYCNGQVYTWLNGSLGARKYSESNELRREYSVCSINAAALLQGRLPRPTFVYGTVGFELSLLGVINFDFDASFELGNDCTLVN